MTRARDLAAFVSNADGDIKFDTDTLFIDSSANRVGIGTTTPDTALHVNSGTANNAATFTSTDAYALIKFEDNDTTTETTLGALDNDMVFRVGAAERMRIDSSGNVGIGTAPVAAEGEFLQLGNYAISKRGFTTNAYYDGSTYRAINTGGGTLIQGGDNQLFYTGASVSAGASMTFTERMRIDSSGVVLVGMTSANGVGATPSDINGTEIGRGYINLNRDDTANVDNIQLGQNGAVTGTIGCKDQRPFFSSSQCGIRITDAQVLPTNSDGGNSDNVMDLGASGVRWDDIFATNGTIQTSDENEKQQIASLTDAEMTAAKAISKLFKTFKWNDKVEAKGDAARTHTGVVAQQVETAMSDAGLDASKYAFWCSDTWWEKDVEVAAVEAVAEELDEDGNVVTEAVEAQEAYTRTDTYDTLEEAPEGATERNRKGIRYPELLSFIGAATEQRLTSIEARLDALEA